MTIEHINAEPAARNEGMARLVEVFGGQKYLHAFTSGIVEMAVQRVVKKSSLAKRADAAIVFFKGQATVNESVRQTCMALAQELSNAEVDRGRLQKMVEDVAEIATILPSRIRVLEKRIADLEAEKADHAGS